jgi:hypothetical protein
MSWYKTNYFLFIMHIVIGKKFHCHLMIINFYQIKEHITNIRWMIREKEIKIYGMGERIFFIDSEKENKI